MKKPEIIPVFDSNQVQEYLNQKLKPKNQYMLGDIIAKLRHSYCNGSLISFSKDFLYKENYPQLSDDERAYIKTLLKEFGIAKYNEAQIYFWW